VNILLEIANGVVGTLELFGCIKNTIGLRDLKELSEMAKKHGTNTKEPSIKKELAKELTNKKNKVLIK
jgi:hypothetical protein